MLLCVVLFSILGTAFAPPGEGSRMCFSCTNVKNPADCNTIMKCGHGQHTCYTRVTFENGGYSLSQGCTHDCTTKAPSLVIGKRRPHEHGDVVCQKCCGTNQCNDHGCESALPSPPTTTAALPACRDHESDGFKCTDYDQYKFCTDTNSLSHQLALDRCPQHCGFCDANGNFKDTFNVTINIDQTTTVTMATDSPVMMTTTAGSSDCVDKEDAGFKCQQWASYGFCTDTSGTGYDIAVQRCSKYCGFCS